MVMEVNEQERALIIQMRRAYNYKKPVEVNIDQVVFLWKQNVRELQRYNEELAKMDKNDRLYPFYIEKHWYHEMRLMQLGQKIDEYRKTHKGMNLDNSLPKEVINERTNLCNKEI